MTQTHWTEDTNQVRLLEERLRGLGMSRRHFLQVVGAASAATAVATTATPADASVVAESPSTQSPLVTRPQRPQVFRSGEFTADPASHDFNADLYCGGVPSLFAGLTVFDHEFNVLPYVAQTWEANSDGSVWTFKLRADANWSNGDPVTAQDFAWSIVRQLEPETAAPYASFFYDIKGAEPFNKADPKKVSDADRAKMRDAIGVKAVDAKTLQVTLEGPRGYLGILMAYAAALPAHKPSVDKFKEKWTESANIVTNGPFLLSAWEHDKRMELSANPNFFGGKAKLDKVMLPIVPFAAGIAPYENDEIDFRSVQAPDWPRVQSDPKLSQEYIKFSHAGTWYLEPSVKHAPFDNVQVRRAIMHSIDRDEIVDVVLKGLGYPAYTFNPPDTPGYVDPAAMPEFKERVMFDPKKAMDMLKGTQFEGGKNWPKITMTMREEGAGPKQVAETIQAMLKENLGMTVDLDILERRVFREKMWKHEIQLLYVRWYQDYPDPHNELHQCFYSDQTTGSRHGWKNERFNDLVKRAAGEINWDKRFQMYTDAEKIMQDEAAITNVYYPLGVALVKPYVKGIPTNKAGFHVPNWNIFVEMYRQLSIE